MEVSLSGEDAAFREEVRAFIAANYPPEMRVPNPETDLNGGMGTTDELNVGHYLTGAVSPAVSAAYHAQNRRFP